MCISLETHSVAKQVSVAEGWVKIKIDRCAKIAKISKLNNFYSCEYFFMKLHIQKVQVDSKRSCEF